MALVDLFFAALPTDADPALADAWERGRRAWPGVDVSVDDFARHVATRVSAVAADTTVILHRLDVAGLYLAAAVLAGNDVAIRAVVELVRTTDASVRQLGGDPAAVEEVRQRVIEAVVVGGARGPAIAGYAGRSDLTSWLRSVAVRTALKMWSRRQQPSGRKSDDDLAVLADDPQIAHLKARYAEPVSAAIREAIAALSPRARTVLRLHHLEGLSLDEIARVYGVHRTTAARWLAAARELVFEETQHRLEASLGVGQDSAISIVRLVHSQLLLSLPRLLATDAIERVPASRSSPS